MRLATELDMNVVSLSSKLKIVTNFSMAYKVYNRAQKHSNDDT